jgi:hypothetical protein
MGRAAIRLVASVLMIGSVGIAAQGIAATYNWYGQLVAFDPASRTATISLLTQDHVPAVVARRFKPGDRVIVTWSTAKGEGDYVIFVPAPDEMKNVDRGYLLPADFVAADAAGKTITVKREVPPALVPTFQALRAGEWIKVATSFEQPGQVAELVSAAAAEKPSPRPKTSHVDQATALKNATAAPLASVAGAWTLSTTFFGQTSSSECAFTQEGVTLGGTCTAGAATGPVTGQVTGRVVKFQFTSTLANTAVTLDYTAIVDAAGQTMAGSTSIFDNDVPFEAKKK